MKFPPFVIPCAVLGSILVGCVAKDTSVIDDTSYNAGSPSIGSVSVDPASIDLGTLPPSPPRGYDTVAVTFTIRATVGTGTVPATVTSAVATLTSSQGSLLGRFPLHNDGVSPDAVAGDTVFTGTATARVLRNDVGAYRLMVEFGNDAGNSDVRATSVTVANSSNHRPVILSVDVPDTVDVPTSDSVYIYRFTALVADSDGGTDIVSVAANVRDASGAGTGTLALYDDGNIPEHGDSTAGDGIYSRLVRTDSTNTRHTHNDFLFYAVDRAGAVSDTVRRTIYTR